MEKTPEIRIVVLANLRRLIDGEKRIHGRQKEIALSTGIEPVTLSKILKGKRNANPDQVMKLAAALGVDELSIYQPYKPPKAVEPDPIAIQVLEYNRTMADAGRHMTKLQSKVEDLEAKLAHWERLSVVPEAILEKLTRLNWRARGIVAQLKLAMRPFLKDESIHPGQKLTRTSGGKG